MRILVHVKITVLHVEDYQPHPALPALAVNEAAENSDEQSLPLAKHLHESANGKPAAVHHNLSGQVRPPARQRSLLHGSQRLRAEDAQAYVLERGHAPPPAVVSRGS